MALSWTGSVALGVSLGLLVSCYLRRLNSNWHGRFGEKLTTNLAEGSGPHPTTIHPTASPSYPFFFVMDKGRPPILQSAQYRRSHCLHRGQDGSRRKCGLSREARFFVLKASTFAQATPKTMKSFDSHNPTNDPKGLALLFQCSSTGERSRIY